MSAADSYQVWTDGACSKNPGEGGWAFVIHQQQKKVKSKKSINLVILIIPQITLWK